MCGVFTGAAVIATFAFVCLALADVESGARVDCTGAKPSKNSNFKLVTNSS